MTLQKISDGGRGSIGMTRYASILRFLVDAPRAASEIATKFGSHVDATYALLRDMRRLELVHVADWQQPERCSPVQVWAFGHRPDAPAPLTLAGKASKRAEARVRFTTPRPQRIAFAAFMRAITEGHSRSELMEATGLHYDVIRRLTNHMRAIGLAHIFDWELTHTGGAQAPIWKFGIDLADKKRPKPLTNTEICRRVRQAKRDRTLVQRYSAPPIDQQANA